MTQREGRRIAVYYGIAILLSALARLAWHGGDPADPQRSLSALALVAAAGPALGAAAVMLIFHYRSRMSFGGTAPRRAAAMLAVPALALAAHGMPNAFGIGPHWFGLSLGLWIAAPALLEEIGWRGYLQDELHDRPAWRRYALIGLFWYAWHLSWLRGEIGSEIGALALMIAASAGIGIVADRTGSVCAAAALHIAADLAGLTTDLPLLPPDHAGRLLLVAPCLLAWAVILRGWWRRLPPPERSRGYAPCPPLPRRAGRP